MLKPDSFNEEIIASLANGNKDTPFTLTAGLSKVIATKYFLNGIRFSVQEQNKVYF